MITNEEVQKAYKEMLNNGDERNEDIVWWFILQQEKVNELLKKFFKEKKEGKNIVRTYRILDELESELK